jgi:hypothetical protein
LLGDFVILTDNPIPGSGADEFGFREHAEVLCQAIEETGDLPLTVGVFGPWGSGKSSFLNICRDLLRDRGFVAVSFNPWKYDKRDEIWHALIQTLLDELIQYAEEPRDRPMTDKVRRAVERAWELRGALAWLAAGTLTPIVTHGVISGDLVGKVRDAASKRKDPRDSQAALGYRHINVFEKDFADTVKALTDGRRMIVLVDDLDRCRGESALIALEALRLFTGDAPCVFMVAMDLQALIGAAAEHFDNDAIRGRNYLEKLINFPYYLPAARFESISRSFRKKLDYLAEDETMWELIRNHMGGNPRRIRRFINTFNLALGAIARGGPTPSRDRQLQVAILLMFRQEHPAFFEFLARDARSWNDTTSGHTHVWGELASFATNPELVTIIAEKPSSSTAGSLESRQLVAADPALPEAVASVASDRKGFVFPHPPTRDQIAVLTEAMVLLPLSAVDAGTATEATDPWL